MKIFLSIFIIINFLYANKTIKAVIPANFLPYYSVDKDGTVSGFAVDVLNEVAKNSNFKVEYIVKDSFSSASDYLLEGKADLIPNSGISKNRMKNSIFTTPMDTFNIKAFKRKVTTTISNLDDIKDKKIVIVKSNIGARLMKNHPSDLTTTVNSPEEAIFLLITGQVDVLVFPEIIINNLLKQLDLSDKVVSFGKPLKEIKRAIRVHKSQANLAQKLDKELRKFLKTKEYQKIYTKWFKNNMYPPSLILYNLNLI
ncbi:MAG: transporter substrate-binding domain-containing protein [Campylobacterota bacterium]|nr:transporter substrate-binding domain-containing protein [Campylobacterota bacterium]